MEKSATGTAPPTPAKKSEDKSDDDGKAECCDTIPFPLTLFVGDCSTTRATRGGFFGRSWVGTLLRMCGILFILTTTLLSNGDILELEVILMVPFSIRDES